MATIRNIYTTIAKRIIYIFIILTTATYILKITSHIINNLISGNSFFIRLHA